jgi:hypothetical protein
MENLIFIHRGQLLTKRIIGVMFIIIAIMLFILNRDSLKLWDWLESILFILIGVTNLTPLSGSDKTCLGVSNNSLKIRWRGWIREVNITDTEIEKIRLARTYILIMRKAKKEVRIGLDYLEREQKTKVYEYLIEYARQKNIALER